MPHLLNQVRGGLVMIPLERAAGLVETCRRYIQEQLFEQKMIPNWQNLDTLADAITSVEYYLERLVEDHASQGETILDVAEESLSSLGYSPHLPLTVVNDDVLELEAEQDVADTLEVESAEHEPLADTHWSTITLDAEVDDIAQPAVETEALPAFSSDSFSASGDAFDLPTLVDDIELEIVEEDFVPAEPLCATEEIDLLGTEATTDAQADFVIDLASEVNAVEAPVELELSEPKDSEPALPASEPQALDLSDIPDVELPQIIIAEASEHEPVELSLQDVMSSSVAPVNPPATDIPPSILPPPADEEPVDQELQEVFVEEAEEVLETLNEFYPKWRANQDDQEALTEVRRAFHTLKGSGRMVRALVAGELAWSIENMLNRVIDGSVAVSQPLLQVIADVITLFPELVEEYAKQQQRQRDDVDQLAAMAHALARNEPLPDFATAAVSDMPDWDASDDFSDFAEEDALEINLELPEQSVASETDHVVSVEMPKDHESIDPVLLEIFNNEAQAHLQTLVGFLADCAQQLPKAISDDLQRALHTLKGSAFMAGILPVAHIAAVLEKLAKEYQANLLAVEFNEALLLSEAEQLLRIGIDQLETTPLQEIDGSAAFIEKLEQVMHARLAHAEDL